ncbi:hypothetical protein DFH08DRAFT_1050307 [Mycena albidolilacea]|uniref:Uncharacterized protein n=1 Tax=Mycena albidolilacea TaxID=1033008 RepID=A0AAD7EBZ1_9AGAR|nr:hypothetical protein DFH08DRAFT_1050307 [Mycena albidolilacea]
MLDAGYHDRRRATMRLSIPRPGPLPLSFSAPRYALSSSWVPAHRRVSFLRPQREALGGGGKVGGWRGRHEQKEEEGGWEPLGRGGEPRERDSATWRKEAPDAVLVCCNASLASRPRYGRSFRLENWVEPHSESFFHRRLRLPISSHFDSTRLVPFHTLSPSPSLSAPLHFFCSLPARSPLRLCPISPSTDFTPSCAFHLATSRTRARSRLAPAPTPNPTRSPALTLRPESKEAGTGHARLPDSTGRRGCKLSTRSNGLHHLFLFLPLRLHPLSSCLLLLHPRSRLHAPTNSSSVPPNPLSKSTPIRSDASTSTNASTRPT